MKFVVMLRLLGITIAIISSSLLSAQGELKLGFQSGVNFSYRFLSENSDDPQVQDAIRHLDTYESPGPGYRFAFVGDYQISKHFNLEVGAAVTRNQYVYFNSDTDSPFFDPINDEFVGPDESIESVERSSNYLYAGLPFRGIYRAGLSSLKFLGHIGLSPQVLVDNTYKNTITYTNGSKQEEERDAQQDLANFNFFPFFGVGLEWELKGKWCLRTEAVARYGALDISNESPINTRLVSSEFTAGIYYSLRSGKDSTE